MRMSSDTSLTLLLVRKFGSQRFGMTHPAGLFSNFGPLYLCDTKKYLAKLGLSVHIAKIHSEVSFIPEDDCLLR